MVLKMSRQWLELLLVAVLLCVGSSLVLGQDPSPAELSFAMAELSSTVTSTHELHTFSPDQPELNENEVDASSEGLTDREVFGEIAATVETKNCTKSPGAPANPNPTVAIVDGQPISKTDFASSGLAVTVPKLLDPQPQNGIQPAGKRTPGFHCQHRVSCESCLALSTCLWNEVTNACGAMTTVGALPRREQWNFITTCNRFASPTEKHTDRRSRSGVQQARHHRRSLGKKSTFTPIVALVEVDTDSTETTEGTPLIMKGSGMKMFLDEEPSLAIEAADLSEATNEALPVPIATKARFSTVDTMADEQAATETEAETETDAEAENDGDIAAVEMTSSTPIVRLSQKISTGSSTTKPSTSQVGLVESSASIATPIRSPKVWPNNIVYYCFGQTITNPTFPSDDIAPVRAAFIHGVAQWSAPYTGVTWIELQWDQGTKPRPPPLPTGEAHPREVVAFELAGGSEPTSTTKWLTGTSIADSVVLKPQPGHWEGGKLIRDDRLTLPKLKRDAVHELGHVLGLKHTFQRSDRDSYVTVASSLSRQAEQYGIVTTGVVLFTPFDFASVMMYEFAEGFMQPKKNMVPVIERQLSRMGLPTPATSDYVTVRQIYETGTPIQIDAARSFPALTPPTSTLRKLVTSTIVTTAWETTQRWIDPAWTWSQVRQDLCDYAKLKVFQKSYGAYDPQQLLNRVCAGKMSRVGDTGLVALDPRQVVGASGLIRIVFEASTLMPPVNIPIPSASNPPTVSVADIGITLSLLTPPPRPVVRPTMALPPVPGPSSSSPFAGLGGATIALPPSSSVPPPSAPSDRPSTAFTEPRVPLSSVSTPSVGPPTPPTPPRVPDTGVGLGHGMGASAFDKEYRERA